MNIFQPVTKKLNSLNPNHHAIARGMIWVALFVFLGKIAGAAKEMVVAYRYGVSEEVDAYIFINNLVTWPVSIWSGLLSFVLVPLAARIRQESPGSLPRFRAELLAFTLILGLDLGLIAWFALPMLFRTSWIGLPEQTLHIGLNILPAMVALIPLGVLLSLFSAWMLASERHTNTLLESVPALVILAAILIFPDEGISPLVWGTVAGFILHAASLGTPLAFKGEIDKPVFKQKSSQWTTFWHGFGVLLVGNSLMSFIGIIDQFFAAHLGTGFIASLSYANRVLSLILGLGATAISRATLPIFSKIKEEESGQLYRVAMFWVRLMFLLGMLAIILCWWLAPWGIKILFERGAFTPKNTQAVTEVFRYGLGQLPFYFSALVLVSYLASRRLHKLIAIGAGINLLIKAGANYVLVPLLGINGIIIATVIMYLVSFLMLFSFAVKTQLKLTAITAHQS